MNKLLSTFNNDTRQGIFFGINSGVLTTVGVIAGISQTTTNPMIVVVSVLSLAISDCVGESYGMYLSKKAEKVNETNSGPVVAMISMFIAKFLTVICFLIPLLFVWNIKYYKNLMWPVLYAVIMLTIIDIRLSKLRGEDVKKYFATHGLLLFVVVISTKHIGQILSKIK
jgi:VIT1/CCC1 family predicted Fe2+/Mn2+ transporter